MALQNNVAIIGVKEAQIAIGASRYRCLGADSLSIDPDIIHANFEGDGKTLGGHSSYSKAVGKLVCATIPLSGIAAITGLTISSAGVTPNQVDTLSHKVGINFPEFILLAKSKEVSEAGQAGTKPSSQQVKVYRCKLTAMPRGIDAKGYKTCDLTFDCYPDLSTDKIWDDINYETEAAL